MSRLRVGPGPERINTATAEIWRDPARPAAERVEDLLGRMTLEEKVAQLTSIWIGDQPRDANVAPMQGEMSVTPLPLAELIRDGLGQVTRVFGTRPLPPAAALSTLRELQAQVAGASRFGIPAVAHEECLTGFAAWTATVFPTPLAWGASFDPDLVHEMAGAIGASMRSVGVHQGLAPVLDVARDMRWGRTEETIGEDPYLVGSIGTAYVRGLQSAGIEATLKHFAGYSASRTGRNMAPVSMGPREFADVMLVPFEMALRLGGARSVMPSYTDVDGVPVSGDRWLLTGLLRDELGFDGVVVSDYFAISFLQTQHGVAGTPAQAAALALDAGMDVELPSVRCYGPELTGAVRDGLVPAELVDRAAARVLRQKCDLGLLDPGWSPAARWPTRARRWTWTRPRTGRWPGGWPRNPWCCWPTAQLAGAPVAAGREYRGDRAAGRRSASLLRLLQHGPSPRLPVSRSRRRRTRHHAGGRAGGRVARRDDLARARLRRPRRGPLGLRARRRARPGGRPGGGRARGSAGLFGRGTSGEGCDVSDLRLPGVQEDLLRVLVATGKPVVLVLVTGRPYAIGPLAGQLAAAVQAFFPGEEGGGAIAGVLSGRVVPSGRLPVELPRLPGGQPSSYLRPRLAGRHPGSSVDPVPLFAFGHGLSYTTFEYADLVIRSAEAVADVGDPDQVLVGTDGTAEITCTVRNTGTRAGTEVVQLYLGDPVAQVVRPVRWLAGFARVPLEPGQARRVTFRLHTDRTAFCGRDGARVVEPGEIQVAVGGASDRLVLHGSFTLCGAERPAGANRVLDTPVVIDAPQ